MSFIMIFSRKYLSDYFAFHPYVKRDFTGEMPAKLLTNEHLHNAFPIYSAKDFATFHK